MDYDSFEKGENIKIKRKQKLNYRKLIKVISIISLCTLLIIGSLMWRNKTIERRIFLQKESKTLAELGVKVPEIIFPKNMDVKSWATIACDQFTQDREYWKNVDKETKGKPSTYKITFPEVYLNDPDKEDRIKAIRKEMDKYMKEGLFEKPKEEMIYLERTTHYGRTRKGLVTAIDLETYEWKPFSKELIRATEQTIIERIPPRIKIRRGAPLELPHILLLVNDQKKQFIEGIGERVKKNKPIYDGELMLDSGSVKGWEVSTKEDLEFLRKQLAKVAIANTMKDGSIFLFAVGDGNHSLATAKAIWEEYKKEHPNDKENKLRYALVEIENIYDDGMVFEPIHRVVFNVNGYELLNFLKEELRGSWRPLSNPKNLKTVVTHNEATFGFVFKDDKRQEYIALETKIKDLAVSRFQPALDKFLEKKLNRKPNDKDIDFIHGDDEIFRLGKMDNTITIMLPPIAKQTLFPTVNNLGPLPRKSFSMGEASEKRFYLECRDIS